MRRQKQEEEEEEDLGEEGERLGDGSRRKERSSSNVGEMYAGEGCRGRRVRQWRLREALEPGGGRQHENMVKQEAENILANDEVACTSEFIILSGTRVACGR